MAITEFENHIKSLIYHCEQRAKGYNQKWSIWRVFKNIEAGGQTVLPEVTFNMTKNWWEMPKMKKSNATF